MILQIRVEHDPADPTIVSVVATGEIDMQSAGMLGRHLDHALSGAPPPSTLLLDLRQVRFIDSTGLRMLVGTVRRCEALATSFRLLPSPGVQAVLEISGLVDLLRSGTD